MKDIFTKVFLLAFILAVTLQTMHLSLLDEVLLVYVGVSLLFRWNGSVLFFGGIAMLAFTTLMVKSRPGLDVTQLERYQWWLMGTGILLIAVKRVSHYGAQFFVTAKTAKLKSFTPLKVLPHALKMSVTRVQTHDLRVAVRSARASLHQSIVLGSAWLKMVGRSAYGFLSRMVVMAYHHGRRVYHSYFGRFSPAVKSKIVIMIVAVFTLFFYTQFEPENILLCLFAMVFFLFRLDSRIPLVGALACFLGVAVTFLAHKTAMAETLAISAYYFLLISMIEQVIKAATARHH